MALGRALVRDPRVFLMDEPLSNLDAKLRVQMRSELKRFHQDLNATIIYVTHDQLEAVTMADKMAVMNGGVLQQYDTPGQRLRRPGQHLRRRLRRQPGDEPHPGRARQRRAARRAARRRRLGAAALRPPTPARRARASGRKVVLGARHSTLRLAQGRRRPARVPGRVYTVEPTGDITFAHVHLAARWSIVSVPPTVALAPDEPVWIEFDQDRLHLFDGETAMALKAA